ncbi:PaaI family thioesterase [Lactobacillus sp. DCY120]|uniref:PaaI family thioesterase n=1 Tax=Bombilactobacillus apium TaxID=2675299 RepID=A0A850R0E6_9LACO|nr:PaaI family thioesterase [Bombilactobacillus apium]NVY96403.1 PaaI family thioesterase [Bombilactobacillus apium]
MDLIKYLGIETIELTAQKVRLRLAVTPQVSQPAGLVHGGINCVLAETAASLGASYQLDKNQQAVGSQINTSHLCAVRQGWLWVQATPVRQGRRQEVWIARTYQKSPAETTSLSTVTLSIINST